MNDYEKQANDFLTSTNTQFDIEYLYTGYYFPDDQEKRDIYQFTLRRGNKSYTHKFGDSIRNTEEGRKLSAYDILACLQRYDVGTFVDFCSAFGYDDKPLSEFPNVLQKWQDCVNEYRALSFMFNDEMGQLQEIN